MVGDFVIALVTDKHRLLLFERFCNFANVANFCKDNFFIVQKLPVGISGLFRYRHFLKMAYFVRIYFVEYF